MRFLSLVLIACLAVSCTSVSTAAPVAAVHHPEASPFDASRDAGADVDAALTQGKSEEKIILVVMGANWCHDSRALAGWFETDKDISMVLDRDFVVAYVDVAQKNRNIDIAQRFGIDSIVGTPTVIMVASDGTVLNRDTAVTWRNSASRTKAEIKQALDTADQL